MPSNEEIHEDLEIPNFQEPRNHIRNPGEI